MKLKIKGTLVLLTGIILFYSACKKSEKKPDPDPVIDAQTQTTAMTSSQLGLNISQTFNGLYGGVNINDGISLPSFATSNHVKPVINNPDTLCSFLPDSVVSYNTTTGDTLKSKTSGFFSFFVSCANGKPNGYTAYDSLATTGKGAARSFIYNVSQYFQVKGLNASNTLLSVDGKLKSYVDVIYNDTTKKPVSVHSFYTLTGLTFDLSKGGDITSGTASFQSVGTNSKGSWYFTGTITFVGNHKANILINNKTYATDLLTGKVTIGN